MTQFNRKAALNIDKFRMNKEKIKNRIKHFYTHIVTQLITGGREEDRLSLKEDELQFEFDKIYTKHYVRKVFFLSDFPEEIDYNLLKRMRFYVKDGSINMYVLSKPFSLDMGSLSIRAKMLAWKRAYDSMEERNKSMTYTDKVFESRQKKEQEERIARMVRSWEYILDSVYSRKRALAESYVFLEILSSDLESSKRAEKQFKEFCRNNHLHFKKIKLYLLEYLKAFSPMSLTGESLITDIYKPRVFTDEIISGFSTYTQGIVEENLDKIKGRNDMRAKTYGLLYAGTDIDTNRPVFLELRKNKAENVLIMARTGAGKTEYTKIMFLFMYILKYNIIILDFNGDEWEALGKLFDAKFINLNDEGSYFDTLAVGTLTGNDSIDNGLLVDSINTTKRVFDVLCGGKMSTVETAIFNDCLIALYEYVGVDRENKLTWANTAKLSFYDFYEFLKLMRQNKVYYEKYGKDLDNFIDKLRIYFDPTGIKHYMFKNKIKLEDLLGQRLIIFSFGSKGKSANLFDESELALKQLYVSYITNLIANYNKAVKNDFTVCFWEEFQRYGRVKGVLENTIDVITDGRKRNLINFLITNDPVALLEENTRAIATNATSFVIGKLPSKIIDEVCNMYDLQSLTDDLKLISSPGYKYVFILGIEGEDMERKFMRVKMLIPRELLESEPFKSRSDYLDIEEQ